MFSLWHLISSQGSIKTHNNGSHVIAKLLSQNPSAVRVRRLRFHLCNAGACESHDDSHYVDRKLKLQELGNAVIDITAPHHSLYDAGEVVISQDDVGSFLSNVSSSNTLRRGSANKTADTTM